MPIVNQSGSLTSPVSSRFFSLLVVVVLAACAGWATIVLGSASWTETRQLDNIFPFYRWRIRWFTADELRGTVWILALLTTGFGGCFLALAGTAAGRVEVKTWTRETRMVMASLSRKLSSLPTRERRIAGVAFSLLTALRVWLSQPNITPGYDDVPSYELFASKSLLAVSAYYPVPNNHVLANTLSWLCYQLNPNFWFTMRFPVLLAATVATGLLFTGLLHARVRFRTALLAVVLFGLVQPSLYHAAVGRGYWLQVLLAGIVFFSTLAIRGGTGRPRAAWTGLMLGSVLGAFTIPTFGYVLVSAFSWLGLGYLKQRERAGLVRLAVAAGAVVMASLLLYTPLFFVSGPNSLLNNGFIAPLPARDFWLGLPAYWWKTEGYLAGQMTVGAVLTITVLVTGALAIGLRRATTAWQLNQRLAWQKLAPAALWFILLPYVMMMGQRVFAPGRTLLYKSFFFFLLLSLVLDELLRSVRSRQRQGLLAGAGIIIIIFWSGYQLNSLARESQPIRRRNTALHLAFAWLARQPAGPMLIPEPTQSIFIRQYLHAELAGSRWDIDARPQPGVRYAYVLAFPDRHGQFQPHFSTPPVFHNEQVDIYRALDIESNTYWNLAN